MLPGKSYTPSDIFFILKRRAALLIGIPLVAAFGTLVYSAFVPDVYESDVLVAIVPQRVPDQVVQTTVTMRTEDRLETLAAQVLSRTVLEQLIIEFNLYPEERRKLPMEDVVALMREDITGPTLEIARPSARGPEPPHAFHLKYKTTDPTVAAKVTQRLGSIFVDQNAQDRGSLAQATAQFLDGQLAEARQRLEEQEQLLKVFREQHGNELPTQVSTNMQAVTSTQMQIQALVEALSRDRDRKLMLERLYGEAQNEPLGVRPTPASPTPIARAQGSPSAADTIPTTGTAQEQLNAAREALARLELRLKPQHPDVIRTRRLIAELEPKAAAEAATKTAGDAAVAATSTTTAATVLPEEAQRRESLRQMRAEIESLDRQTKFKESEETRLRGLVSEYQRRLEAVPGTESEWTRLTRDYDTLQTAYKDLLRKAEAAKTALELERRQIGEQFRILDPARVPERPASPLRIRINAIGLGIGIVLALGIAGLLEIRDTTYRTESDVLDVLRLPVLAVVPQVMTAAELARQKRRRMMQSWAAVSVVVVAGYVFWALRLWTRVY